MVVVAAAVVEIVVAVEAFVLLADVFETVVVAVYMQVCGKVVAVTV